MCEVLNNVVNVISGLDGVLEVRQLSNDDILKIIDMEAQRSKDIVPVFNEGVQECFKRDVCFVIFKKGYFRVPPTPTVLLTFDGEILGHDVFDPEDKKKFRDDEDIMFLSDDFVIFKDVLNNYNLEKGNEYFVLPPVPFPELDRSMSTRKGVFVSVDELVDEAVKRAADEIKSRNPDLTDEEIKPMAEDIGVGAIRFFIAKLSPEKHLTFKWDEALSFERGCASIQYAHARACKLLKKSGKDVSSLAVSDDWVPNENEKDLIRTIAKFPQVIEDCANKKRIHNITQYCQDLASAFNKFYKAEQVIGSDVEDTRLVLVDRAKTTLKNALDILGVPAPQKM